MEVTSFPDICPTLGTRGAFADTCTRMRTCMQTFTCARALTAKHSGGIACVRGEWACGTDTDVCNVTWLCAPLLFPPRTTRSALPLPDSRDKHEVKIHMFPPHYV